VSRGRRGGECSSAFRRARREENDFFEKSSSGSWRREKGALARCALTVRCAHEKREKRRGVACASAADVAVGVAADARRARTFPKVHAKGGNTSASCNAGVATIFSTMSLTLPGWSRRGGEESDEIWVRAR
jgi:hypothetical protein